MRRVYDQYKNEKDFLILSHTCMPETDSVPVLKSYENWMLNGKLNQKKDGAYTLDKPADAQPVTNNNWYFVTGDKKQLYDMARYGYMIDNGAPDTSQIKDQFLHTQFFALVDKRGRVRGIYDGLQEKEVQHLMTDIKELLNEKVTDRGFKNGFSNMPE